MPHKRSQPGSHFSLPSKKRSEERAEDQAPPARPNAAISQTPQKETSTIAFKAEPPATREETTARLPPLLDPTERPTTNSLKIDSAMSPPSTLRNPFLKRMVFSLFLAACGLLGFYLTLELIQAVDAILSWPLWAGIPALVLIAAALSYTVYRAIKFSLCLRRLRRVKIMSFRDVGTLPAECRDRIRDELLPHLRQIRDTPSDREPGLMNEINSLLENLNAVGSESWLERYRNDIQPALRRDALSTVKQIAIASGTAAALSPWKLLDAFIAINASLEAGAHVLRVFGIRPDPETVAGFAFDSLLATFFAVTVEEIAENAVETITEGISSSIGQKLTEVVAPKVAQGVAVGFFIRRIGSRMVKKLAPK